MMRFASLHSAHSKLSTMYKMYSPHGVAYMCWKFE